MSSAITWLDYQTNSKQKSAHPFFYVHKMEREWEQHRAAISPLPAETCPSSEGTPGWLWLSQAFLRSAPSLSCAGYQLQQQTQFPHGFLQLQWGKRMDREKGRGWTERRQRGHFSHLPFLTAETRATILKSQSCCCMKGPHTSQSAKTVCQIRPRPLASPLHWDSSAGISDWTAVHFHWFFYSTVHIIRAIISLAIC